MTSRRVLGLVLALLAALCASCAPLPTDKNPRSIDRDRVPDLFPAPTTTVPPSPAEGAICFVSQSPGSGNSDIECIRVNLEEVSPRTLIDALAAGPDEDQKREGLASPIPQDTKLLGAERATDDPQVMVIDLSSAINSLSAPNNTDAFRQIVETLTNPVNDLGIDAIRVEVEGKPTKIPTDRGLLNTASTSDFLSTSSTTTTGRR